VFQGTLVSIFVAEKAGAPMRSVPRANAVTGKGIEGDRSFPAPRPDYQVTLIEEEAVAAAAAAAKAPIEPIQTRRNLVTRGVPLNHLVGREFTVGSVRLKGHRLCEPCQDLEKATRPGTVQDLLHRGGLRAEVLSGGTLEPGQAVRPA
jgi:MOSC domain-containing protein YiiM